MTVTTNRAVRFATGTKHRAVQSLIGPHAFAVRSRPVRSAAEASADGERGHAPANRPKIIRPQLRALNGALAAFDLTGGKYGKTKLRPTTAQEGREAN
jgi:hypothetical protein